MRGIRMWLDDERDPSDATIRELFGLKGDEVWVKSSVEAIELLRGGGVEWMSLGGCDTGIEVAAWVEEQAFLEKLSPVKWQVHCDNGIGVDNMKRVLRKANKYWGVIG